MIEVLLAALNVLAAYRELAMAAAVVKVSIRITTQTSSQRIAQCSLPEERN